MYILLKKRIVLVINIILLIIVVNKELDLVKHVLMLHLGGFVFHISQRKSIFIKILENIVFICECFLIFWKKKLRNEKLNQMRLLIKN